MWGWAASRRETATCSSSSSSSRASSRSSSRSSARSQCSCSSAQSTQSTPRGRLMSYSSRVHVSRSCCGIEQLHTADVAERFALLRRVPLFRHLSIEEVRSLAQSLKLFGYENGCEVIKQGEFDTDLFVIKNGEVVIDIDGEVVRRMGMHMYFGERSLLLGEARSATVRVCSEHAVLMVLPTATVLPFLRGSMLDEIMERIHRQNTSVSLEDLRELKVIGSGGMGVVSLVEHRETGRKYALKRIKKNAKGPIFLAVKCELDLLRESDHPFIMQALQIFETASSVSMLTELITGGELFDALRVIPGKLTIPQAQFYAGSVILMLEFLAQRYILYRDLKPENLMCDGDGYLKLIDFGLAKKLSPTTVKTFSVVGTPHYMAPEIIKGKGYGLSADIWSLGVMMYEFLSCHHPFGHGRDETRDIWKCIFQEELSLGAFKDEVARNLMVSMLDRKTCKRLGTGTNGLQGVKAHGFFGQGFTAESTLFDQLMRRQLQPPVAPRLSATT